MGTSNDMLNTLKKKRNQCGSSRSCEIWCTAYGNVWSTLQPRAVQESMCVHLIPLPDGQVCNILILYTHLLVADGVIYRHCVSNITPAVNKN